MPEEFDVKGNCLKKSKTFLWIEDKQDKSGYTFWKAFMEQLFPDVMVESKKNNSELVKSVKGLGDRENRYIIVFDNSFDNLQVLSELKTLMDTARAKENVVLLDIICFEYLLLEFKELTDWVFASDDEFLEKRAGIIKARCKLVNAISDGDSSYKEIREIKDYCDNLERYNIEQLSAKILFELTRNTGFEVSKGSIGECWIKSCCDWLGRQGDDICGLDHSRLDVYEKMKRILYGTSLKSEFRKTWLEVAS